MARRTFTLRRTGSTVVFKSGDYVESFDVEVLGAYQTWERIKWAAFTSGVSLSDVVLEELLLEARGLLPAGGQAQPRG
jgi:hypothetical protein